MKTSIRICAIDTYLPEEQISNEDFSTLCNRPASWFERLTGIKSRRRASPDDNCNTLAVRAVSNLATHAPFELEKVDLVIGASYTPWDTVGTLAHWVQREFGLKHAKAFSLSSACSSFINALEIAQSFAESQRSKRALIVASEHNSGFSRDADEQSGHLWGDGAAAILTSASPDDGGTLELIDIETHGLGHIGHGPRGVYLEPAGDGLVMPYGHEVFQFACREMQRVSNEVLERNLLSVDNLALLVPHQANRRIIDRITQSMAIPPEKVAISLEALGNTGCASIPISLQPHLSRLRHGDYVLAAAFGGGYSSGAALFRAR